MHARTRPVTEFDDDLHVLIRDMFATMNAAEGVGLAATQVGVDLRRLRVRLPRRRSRPPHRGDLQPRGDAARGAGSRKLEAADEGCLSLPGGYVELARPDRSTCRGQDAFGAPVEVTGTGLLARCLQHETDHLNGTVFGDRLSARMRKKLYAQHENLADTYPADWPVGPRLPRE